MPDLKQRYSLLKSRYQNWKKELVFKTTEEDPLAQQLGAGWNELGYHRTIASFFYYMWMLVPEALFGLLLIPLLQFTEYRFPEIGGFKFASVGLFAAMYSIMDLNLKDAINRFVPEYAVKDPRKAMQYVSFFIKYQMWSGLFQIAAVAFLVQYYILRTEFAYLAFYLLFVSIQQYPATLDLFVGLLGSFQRFNKKTNIVILRASFIEPLTKIIFGLIGLYYGMNNPQIGELFGLTMGWAIGGYVDDFFTFTAGTFMLSKVLDEYGIRVREIYFMKVPREVWGSALNYSMRLMPNTVFGAIMGFSGFLITVEHLPGYLTYVGLTGKASDMAGIVSKFSDDVIQDSQPALSESYNNGKLNLTKYYIASGFKYWSFMFMLLGSVNIFGLPIILAIAFEGGFLPTTWSLIIVMVPIYVYLRVLDPFKGIAEKMVAVSNHPEINAVIGIAGTIMNLFFTWYFLAYLQLGWIGFILIGFPSQIMGLIVRWIFMHFKIIRLDGKWWKDVAWQCFVAPLIAGTVFIAYLLFILYVLFPIVTGGLTGMLLILAAAPLILLILIGGLFLYMPIYSWLGGWDPHTLRDFKKAVPLTGPSIIVTYPLLRIAEKFYEKSPFKKKSYLNVGDAAFEELLELGTIRTAKIVHKEQKE